MTFEDDFLGKDIRGGFKAGELICFISGNSSISPITRSNFATLACISHVRNGNTLVLLDTEVSIDAVKERMHRLIAEQMITFTAHSYPLEDYVYVGGKNLADWKTPIYERAGKDKGKPSNLLLGLIDKLDE